MGNIFREKLESGKKMFGPSRAASYGMEDIRDYIENKSKEMVRLVMIESESAVEGIEEMSEIPYLDGFEILNTLKKSAEKSL